MKHHFTYIETLEGIASYVHEKNGLQVLLLNQALASSVTFMVTYKVGSRNEVPGNTGATHLLEHLMFKGTDKFNKEKGTSIFNVLQSVGARINATTSFDRTNYYELLPSSHLELAIQIEADRMRRARISEKDLESERTVVLNELERGENIPIRNLFQAVWSSAFFAHPYHHPVIGWRSDVENATSSSLRSFYDTFYHPNNATISIIGGFDKEEILLLLEQYFGVYESSPTEIPVLNLKEPPQRGLRRVVVEQSGQLGATVMAFKKPESAHPDADALFLLGMVLNNGKSSRMYKHLIDNDIATQYSVSNYELIDPGLFMVFAMHGVGTSPDDVEAGIWKVLQSVIEQGIELSELERAKNQVRVQQAFDRDGSFSIASTLNEAIATGDWKRYINLNERLAAVSVEQIQEVAMRYLNLKTSTIGTYQPN